MLRKQNLRNSLFRNFLHQSRRKNWRKKKTETEVKAQEEPEAEEVEETTENNEPEVQVSMEGIQGKDFKGGSGMSLEVRLRKRKKSFRKNPWIWLTRPVSPGKMRFRKKS